MCSLLDTNIGVNTEKDYDQYSYNLKEKDKNYWLYQSIRIKEIRDKALMNLVLDIHRENRTLHSFQLDTKTEHNRRKDKINLFLHTRNFSLL